MGLISPLAHIFEADSSNLLLADSVQIEPYASIICKKEITIDSDTMIAPGVVITDSDHDLTDPAKIALDGVMAPVHIGKNVWIGANAVILKGVTIGDNAVIGAGAIVTHDVPANEIWVGNPAKKLRDR